MSTNTQWSDSGLSPTSAAYLSEQRGDVFDGGRHHRAKLGFVLLAMEQTIEGDLFQMAPEGVGIHISRGAMADAVNVDTLRAMAAEIGPSAELILPELTLDVLSYACTSGSIVIGVEEVERELAATGRARHVTTLIGGVVGALRALQARRISVVTPYVPGLNELEATHMTNQGFEVDSLIGLEIEKDQDIVRVRPDFLADFAVQHTHPDSDALFISCGALRTLDVIDEIEDRIGRPVVTSNQAMMWDCLRAAGVDDHLDGFGRLFHDH